MLCRHQRLGLNCARFWKCKPTGEEPRTCCASVQRLALVRCDQPPAELSTSNSQVRIQAKGTGKSASRATYQTPKPLCYPPATADPPDSARLWQCCAQPEQVSIWWKGLHTAAGIFRTVRPSSQCGNASLLCTQPPVLVQLFLRRVSNRARWSPACRTTSS